MIEVINYNYYNKINKNIIYINIHILKNINKHLKNNAKLEFSNHFSYAERAEIVRRTRYHHKLVRTQSFPLPHL